jgi:hypothetical protein
LVEDPHEILKRSRALLQAHKESEESRELLEKLPQGPGSGLNADMVDGLHAAEIIAKAPGKGGGGGGSGGGMEQHGNEYHTPDFSEEGHTHAESEITDLDHDAQKIKGKEVDDSAIGDGKFLKYQASGDKVVYASVSGGGDMLKSVYDTDEDGVVDNAEKLEGSTKAEVQNHEPKSHANEAHSTQMATVLELAMHEVNPNIHHAEIHGNETHDPDMATAAELAAHEDDPDIHHPQSHTLASHSTKAHSELTNVTEDQHHAKVHGDAEHSVAYEKTANKGVANGYAELDVDTLILLARLPTIPYSKLNLALSIVNADIAAAAAITETKLALNYPTHPEAHTLASHSSKNHSELTGVSADQHGDTKVRSKVVDESAIGDDKILVFKAASDTLVYEAKPSGGSGTPEDSIMGITFMPFSGLDADTVGGSTGYSVSKYGWGVTLAPGNVANRNAYACYKWAFAHGAFFDKDLQFEAIIYLGDISVMDFYVVVGASTSPSNASQRKFGIRVYAGALRIVSSDGTTQSESSDLMTLSNVTPYRVRCKLTAGSQIEVWVDGVSKGTKNTNLPSGNLSAGLSVPLCWAATLVSDYNNAIVHALKVARAN